MSSVSKKFCYTHISQVYIKVYSSPQLIYNSDSNSLLAWWTFLKLNSFTKETNQRLKIYFYMMVIWFHANSTLRDFHYLCHHQYLRVLPLHAIGSEVVLLLQAKENLHAGWNFYKHWTALHPWLPLAGLPPVPGCPCSCPCYCPCYYPCSCSGSCPCSCPCSCLAIIHDKIRSLRPTFCRASWSDGNKRRSQQLVLPHQAR